MRTMRRRLSPRPLIVFGVRRGLRERGWLCGRLELSQRRAQRIEARCVGKPVVFDGAPDGRRHRGKLVVGEIDCRHGPDIIGRQLSSKERGEFAWRVPPRYVLYPQPCWTPKSALHCGQTDLLDFGTLFLIARF